MCTNFQIIVTNNTIGIPVLMENRKIGIDRLLRRYRTNWRHCARRSTRRARDVFISARRMRSY